MISVHQIINSPVSSNCFVLFDKAVSNDSVIIDPGGKSVEEILSFLENEGLEPKYIILTHEHFDHCWGVNDLVERYHLPIVCSALCSECIQNEKRNCSVFYDNKNSFVITSKTISVESFNNALPWGCTEIHFMESPGHTNASICFTIGRYLFTGDTLIKDLRTVTKLPTGSVKKLQESIDLFRSLQGEGYMVYPGHGESFELDGYDLELMLKGDIPK
jgi:glyoxylase-like metal-dependent hydrolase (beta-lactamase superfamily II)